MPIDREGFAHPLDEIRDEMDRLWSSLAPAGSPPDTPLTARTVGTRFHLSLFVATGFHRVESAP